MSDFLVAEIQCCIKLLIYIINYYYFSLIKAIIYYATICTYLNYVESKTN